MRSRVWASLGVAFLVGCGGGTKAEAPPKADLSVPEAPGVRVETAEVQVSTATLDVSFPGEVEAIEDVSLASPLGGYVEGVSFKRGESLKKGDVIAKVDFSSRVAQREIAAAQAAQAKAELERAKALGDGISRAQVLAAETNFKVAKANADLARINANRSVIRSPFGGTVAEVYVDWGEVAPPGSPIARVVRIDRVKLELSVSDRDINLVKEGQPVTFRTQALPQTFQGKITKRGVAADSKSRTFLVEVELPNPDKILLPGMLGRVYFNRTVAEDAIVIPQAWLVTQRDRTGVFIDEGGKAVWRTVTLGGLARDQAVITDGLSKGEKVVTTGHRSLAEGDSLIVARSGVCCEDGRVRY